MPTIYDVQREEMYTADPRSNTTYDTYGSMGAAVGYMSAIAPRQVIITRPVKNLGGGNRNVTSKMSVSQSMSSSAVTLRGAAGVGKWA
jgi:hypothetical protein